MYTFSSLLWLLLLILSVFCQFYFLLSLLIFFLSLFTDIIVLLIYFYIINPLNYDPKIAGNHLEFCLSSCCEFCDTLTWLSIVSSFLFLEAIWSFWLHVCFFFKLWKSCWLLCITQTQKYFIVLIQKILNLIK